MKIALSMPDGIHFCINYPEEIETLEISVPRLRLLPIVDWCTGAVGLSIDR